MTESDRLHRRVADACTALLAVMLLLVIAWHEGGAA